MTEWTKPTAWPTFEEREGRQALADNWHEEAATVALSGNPMRAGYIEHMAKRVLDPTFGAPHRESS